jgi:hypothetical protein
LGLFKTPSPFKKGALCGDLTLIRPLFDTKTAAQGGGGYGAAPARNPEKPGPQGNANFFTVKLLILELPYLTEKNSSYNILNT